MQHDEQVYDLAQQLKKETGKRVIEISRYGYKREGVDNVYINVEPLDLLDILKLPDIYVQIHIMV